MKIIHGSLRHREQSEATQTMGLQLRLSLGCFLSLAMTVGHWGSNTFPRLQLTGFDDG